MKYQIGLIGCGSIAGAWIEAVGQHEDCRIAMVCDLDEAAAQGRASETGAKAATLDQVLESRDIHLVIVGTPTPSHPDLVTRAAAASKHLLCEKPMALTIGRCRQMIDACRQARVKMAIGHSLRFFPAFRNCLRIIAGGGIGTPVSGCITRVGAAGVERAADQKDPAQPHHWRQDVRNSGGPFLEFSIHELDCARLIFGQIASVSCISGGGRIYNGLKSPDITMSILAFESGAVATMRTGSTVSINTSDFWIAGTEGSVCWKGWGDPVEHHRHDFDEKKTVPSEPGSAYYHELCDLLAAIEHGGEPQNSLDNGLKNVALGLGLSRSIEMKQTIAFQGGLPRGVADDYQAI